VKSNAMNIDGNDFFTLFLTRRRTMVLSFEVIADWYTSRVVRFAV